MYQWLCYHDGIIEGKLKYQLTIAQKPVCGFKTTLVPRSVQQECEGQRGCSIASGTNQCSVKMSIEIKLNHMLVNKSTDEETMPFSGVLFVRSNSFQIQELTDLMKCSLLLKYPQPILEKLYVS